MKNLTIKPGWKNRHIDGMPNESCLIQILKENICGVEKIFCVWKPSNEISPNFIGTAYAIDFDIPEISFGYHAWLSKDQEFVYYNIAEFPKKDYIEVKLKGFTEVDFSEAA